MTIMRRYWINQPSSLQLEHHLHGRLVHAPDVDYVQDDYVTCYFMDGGTESRRIPRRILSPLYRVPPVRLHKDLPPVPEPPAGPAP